MLEPYIAHICLHINRICCLLEWHIWRWGDICRHSSEGLIIKINFITKNVWNGLKHVEMQLKDWVWINSYRIYIYICHSGEFPHLATRENARVEWPILITTPWIMLPAKNSKSIRVFMFSRMKIIDIVLYHLWKYMYNFSISFRPLATTVRVNARS